MGSGFGFEEVSSLKSFEFRVSSLVGFGLIFDGYKYFGPLMSEFLRCCIRL